MRNIDSLTEVSIEASVGSVGDSHDDRLAKTINDHHKSEVIRRCRALRTLEAVEFSTPDLVN
ncbi:hypothetical protein [Azospirillum thiophilum]|uniref:hypothetical protein n=1 Tax=Azospirillum thiophilum TaxID=528244 RepID=UPI000696CDF5|nr:hypothetical protein [Azospirillum thiophilum]